jgi:hypothetical protein
MTSRRITEQVQNDETSRYQILTSELNNFTRSLLRCYLIYKQIRTSGIQDMTRIKDTLADL